LKLVFALFASFTVIVTVFTGCAPELHERLLISAIGVDSDDNGWRVTVRAFTPDQADHAEKSYTGSGETVASALDGIIRQTGKLPLYSHSSVLVFGRNCAEKGLDDCLDFFIRHYDSRPDMNVLLSSSTAEDILKINDGKAAPSTAEIAALINTKKHPLQSADLISLVNGTFGADQTACIPIIQKEPVMHIAGSGLLHDFKLIDEPDADALRGMLLIRGDSIPDETVLQTLSGGSVSVTSEAVSSEIRFTGTAETPRFEITVRINGKINSMERGLRPLSGDVFAEIEKHYAKNVLNSITHYLQTVVLVKGVDAAGFGTALLHDAPEIQKAEKQAPASLLSAAAYSVSVTTNIDRTEEEDTPYF